MIRGEQEREGLVLSGRGRWEVTASWTTERHGCALELLDFRALVYNIKCQCLFSGKKKYPCKSTDYLERYVRN